MKTNGIDLCESPVFDLWKAAGRVIEMKIEGISMLPLLRLDYGDFGLFLGNRVSALFPKNLSQKTRNSLTEKLKT